MPLCNNFSSIAENLDVVFWEPSENLKVGSVDFCEALVPSKHFPGGLASEVVKNNEKTWFTYIPQILNVND